MTLQWVSADLLTGQVIADLPSFDPQWPLRRTIATAEAAMGVLHLAGAPANWERAILDGGTLLACYDNTDPARALVWGGIVWQAGPLDTASDDVPIALSTFESALDNAFVGDVTYTNVQHRDDIIADLITSWFTPNTGINLRLQYMVGGGPTPVETDNPPTPGDALIFQNTDNATVKARMDQVFAQLGGEYTIDLAWRDSQFQFIDATLRFGDRIGQAQIPGFAPGVTFEVPGSLISLQQMRDYTPGKGANRVVAWSSGQGDSTPFSAPVDAPDDGRPKWEYRGQPATGTMQSSLAQYAAQWLAILAPGARAITLTATLARPDGRRLGTDWQLGDDIGYRVAAGIAPAFPNGLDGVGRSLGYQLTDSTVSPILADNDTYLGTG